MKKIGLATLLLFIVIPSVVYPQDILVRRLKAHPDRFVGSEIILKCRFEVLSTDFLNCRSSTYSPYFSSTEFLAFSIRSPNRAVDLDPTLFIKISKAEVLYALENGDKITISGKVQSSYLSMPWIEVYKIKKGWE